MYKWNYLLVLKRLLSVDPNKSLLPDCDMSNYFWQHEQNKWRAEHLCLWVFKHVNTPATWHLGLSVVQMQATEESNSFDLQAYSLITMKIQIIR
jgi:hypothetical protein